MTTLETTRTETLLIEYLDVCNTALAANRHSFPYKQLMTVYEKLFTDRLVTVEIYELDSQKIEAAATVRLRNGTFEPVPEGAGSPSFTFKLKKSYMERVVENRQEYIRHPEKLDWEWLKSRLGIESEGSQANDSSIQTQDSLPTRDQDSAPGRVTPEMRAIKKALIEGLNDAFNREITTVIRYLLQGSTIQGLKNERLRQAYRDEVADELGHAQYLADKIVMLGAMPRLHVQVSQKPPAIDEMMERDLAAEESDIRHYRRLAKMAEQAGEIELKVRMEEQASDETRHAEQLRRLRGLIPA